MSNDPAPAATTFRCPSCGTGSAGPFCTACGEKKLGSDDRSLRHYFDIVADFLTHFDSKGYRSLWYLLARPGFLSEEQLRGARVRYAKPLSLFISLNVVYFLSTALVGVNTFSTPLATQLGQNDYYGAFANRAVETQLVAKQSAYAAFEAKYNERANVLSKTLVFLFIPIYAALFHALFFLRRRYFVEHAVVATHFWSFILLLLVVTVPALALVLKWWHGEPGLAAAVAANDNTITIVLQLCIAAYLTLMMRRVYAVRYRVCIVAAAAIAWSFFHIMWLYRFLLFEITLHSL